MEFDLGAGARDRCFVLEPPFLRLEVVAGPALLVFGHRFVLWLALCGWPCGWLSAEAGCLRARWQRFAPKKAARAVAWYNSHCVKQRLGLGGRMHSV